MRRALLFSVGVFQDAYILAHFFFHQLLHLLVKRAGIVDGGPLLDAAGKGDGIRPSFHQLSGPQHCFFYPGSLRSW